ncbi:MAG: FAD-dependent oxidoreductase [Anaerolineae bacterium]
MKTISCDIAIIGGSMGGVSAQLSALASSAPVDRPLQVIVTEVSAWIGGQMTAQGVSALDEHEHIEHFGGTARYSALREAIREHYRQQYNRPQLMRHDTVNGDHMPFNPGNGWVSRLCFLPRVALTVLEAWVADVYLLETYPVRAEVNEDRIRAVIVENAQGEQTRISARYFLDATDTGDLLPLTGTAYVTGAESQAMTGEPNAPVDYRPQEVQAFTYPFAVEYRAGEDHTIDKPEGYEQFQDRQPYTLHPINRAGERLIYLVFADNEAQGLMPFWTYRRLHHGALLGGTDITMINWGSNDYDRGDILSADAPTRAHYLDEAKRLSLGFLYWLQTECPRDDGGTGYPEFKLRPDVMGTTDGLSQAPYIRESRRIVPLRRVVEQDIIVTHNDGARARPMRDSVGLGWYAMDLHACVGNQQSHLYAATRPFQVPLGALIPQHTQNLLASCKNIGTTHLTNGAYRLHPIEWGIGEAAGIIAAFCLRHDCTPHQLAQDDRLIWRLQYQLVRQGCPIFWAVDVAPEHPLFIATQLLLVQDVIVRDSPRWHRLTIGIDEALGASIDITRLQQLADQLQIHPSLHADLTWGALCAQYSAGLRAQLA